MKDSKSRKNLYFTCLTGYGIPYLKKIQRSFDANKFDYIIVALGDFDTSDLSGKVIRDQGYNHHLLRKHVTDEELLRYKYIFVWDDDLDIGGNDKFDDFYFDVDSFLDIITRNNLDVAQPALTKDSYVNWQNTIKEDNSVGRIVHMVEQMAHVFKSEVLVDWLKLTVDQYPTHKFGWFFEGYVDMIPCVKKQGIIDCEPVRHVKMPIDNDQARQEGKVVLRDISKLLSQQSIFRKVRKKIYWKLMRHIAYMRHLR